MYNCKLIVIIRNNNNNAPVHKGGYIMLSIGKFNLMLGIVLIIVYLLLEHM